MREPSRALTFVVLALTVSCTTMRPTPPRSVEPGRAVVVHLSSGLDVELGSVTVRNVRSIDGTFLRWSDDGQALVVSRRVTTGGGVPQDTQGETLRLDESRIERIEADTPDGTKTGILIAVGAGLVAGTLIAIGARGNRGSQPGPDNGGTTGRVGVQGWKIGVP